MVGNQAINAMHGSLVNGPSAVDSLKGMQEVSKTDKSDFTSALSTAINSLEQKQIASNESVQALVEGKADNMHSVMIKTTEAQLSLELAVQMRNKVLEAYNEVKNIQF